MNCLLYHSCSPPKDVEDDEHQTQVIPMSMRSKKKQENQPGICISSHHEAPEAPSIRDEKV